MNRAFRLIWNPIQNTWIVASEIAKGRGKSTLEKKCVISVIIVSMTPLSLAAPTDGKISAGTGSITQTGQNTNINQSSQNLAINWQSFNIGANEAVNFNQPNTSSIALNRIIGQNPSSILGQLSSNGQVFLINPNGVLFGTGSKVNVGGLVASTLELSDTDFMAGKHTFNGTGGNILNQGTLTATQKGYIALLAPNVRNEGVISATLGTALLAAGNKVTLSLNSGSLLDYNIDQGALKALADNKQLIQADGGQVFISAKAANALSTAVVNNTGIIQAHTVKNINGTIKLMGDMQYGTVNVGSTLDASAPTGGNGGFIETSAAHVHVANDTHITTKATNGKSGTWLIDPVDFTIAASGADMTGTAVSNALTNGNVSIQSVNGKAGTKGDINVNDTINWSANQLTLNAQNDININAVMNASSSASLALEFGQGAVAANNSSNIITGKSGVVNLPASTTNFTTKQGSDGEVKHYTVITSLGAMGSTTTTDLQGISGNDNLNYALGANIDATTTTNWDSGAGFKPVGLKATFNGLGHTISELTINRLTESNIGLFSSIDNTASISNIGLIGGSIAGNQSVGALVGAIQSGSINNSYATSSVKGNSFSFSVGGLVGISMKSVTISNSYATGSVKGYNGVGGLVGQSNGTTISNSFATGSVEGDSYNVGGLVGSSLGTTISNSYAAGSVKGDNNVGGLVGNSSGDTISNSYATGSVKGNNIVGGLVGDIGSGNTISNSYATGSVESKSKVGGLIGHNNNIINVQITNSYYDIDSAAINGTPTVDSYGIYHHQFQDWLNGGLSLNPVTYFGAATATNSYKISGIQGLKDLLGFANKADYTFTLAADIDMADAPSGFYIPSWEGTFDGNNNILSNFTLNNTLIRYTGLFGQTTKGANIKNIGLSNINVSSSIGSSTGGLVGYNQGTINNSYVTGTVTSTSGSNVGGLVGSNANGTISNSYVTGTVTSTSGNSVGGLVGSNSEGTIYNSYVTGTITSTSGDNVGGLVGYNTRGAISNSYASGTVSGATRVGGLIGYDFGTKSISISNNYAANHVNGASNVGGLVGRASGLSLSIYTGNFWDVTRSDLADGLGIGMIKSSAGTVGTPQTGVTGLTTQQMHTQSSFVPTGKDANQWNFTPETGVWFMVEGQSNPLLRALMTPLTVTANNATKTYDGQAYNGSAGVSYSSTPDMSDLSGTLSYHSGINAGTHDITLSGLVSNQNYLINYVNGTLTIEKKPLTITANNATKTYDGQVYNGSAGVSYSSTPDMSDLSGTLSYHSGINAGTHDITLSGLVSNQNYLINYVNGTLTIEKKPITAKNNEAPATSSGDVISRAIRAMPNGEKLIPAYTSALITPQTSPNISNTNNINEGVTTNNFNLFNNELNSSMIKIDKINNVRDNGQAKKKDDSTSAKEI